MNIPMIRNILGSILTVEAVFMLPALGISLARGEGGAVLGFAVTVALLLAAGLPMALIRAKKRDFYPRDGLITTGLTWLLVSLFGALPFFISGAIPSYVDCFFETASGFSTTGASILTDVEALPMGLLYWRSFTHWLGGMGVLVLLLAISPITGSSGQSLFLLQAESPGVKVGKLVPRMRRSAGILYAIYVALTVLMFVLLVFDMPVFDALTTAFATAGTGGFAIKNDSMASYSAYAQTVTTVFMFLFGVNFSFYYLLLLRRFRQALSMGELLCYLGIAGGSILLVTVNILPGFSGFGEALHHAAFTVGSIMSTTGFATTDFGLWPWFSQTLLVLLMFVGASAGSTGGGVKVVRVQIMLKAVWRSVRQTLHPREVRALRADGSSLDDDTVQGVANFLLLYTALFVLFFLLLALDGFDFTSTFTAVAACLNNIGPALGAAGPVSNYSCFSLFGKLVLSAAMLFGRLELYPMLMLLVPAAWRK